MDFDDVLNIGSGPGPTNRNPGTTGINGASLQCITDLVDCCGTESGSPNSMRTQHGDWYFPGGTRVGEVGGDSRFLANRGPNEVINEQQFNGSVRLFRRYSGAPGRGRFRCVLLNAAGVNQTIYINICELILGTYDHRVLYPCILNITVNFASLFNLSHVTTSSSGSNTAGAVYSLMCSSILNSDSIPLPNNARAPTFEWSFGPNGSDPLPSGVTDMGTTSSDSITFTSTLQFSPLNLSHAGNYTCRLGPGRLVNNATVTMDGMIGIVAYIHKFSFIKIMA